MFAGAAGMLSLYLYFGILRDGVSTYPLLLAIGFALSGIAESLPAEQRLLAGGVRVTAGSWLLGLLAVTIFAPGLIL
jgi:sulfite exporter TauE/SafE